MMSRIVDFHTHAFPDALAQAAMSKLHAECSHVKSFLDGRLSSLLESMARNEIEKSILCCIATRPSQFDPIFSWCKHIASERIVPFPSVHPEDPAASDRIYQVAEAGFKGVKMHPYYQDFFVDDPALNPIYHAVLETGLLLTLHTGYDIAFERIERASPKQISEVLKTFPELRLVVTHFGGWQQWDQVERYLLGKPVYMEVSWSMEYLGPEKTRQMILKHSADHILFGTDSPWTDQSATAQAYMDLDLPEEVAAKFFCQNALNALA